MDAEAEGLAPGAMSMPEVLHYLQGEWGRFERERSRWVQERAELQVRGCPE